MPKKQPEVKLSKARAKKTLFHILRIHENTCAIMAYETEEVNAFEKLVTFLIKEF